MKYSLNEIDAHCKKAARGIGLQWGYAEEIGKAARWLAAYDLPGIAVLTAYLVKKNSHPKKLQHPEIDDNIVITCNKKLLCPIYTGAYLSDQFQINLGQQLQFKHLGYPLLLLPYLAQLARAQHASISYRYQQTRFEFANGILEYHGKSSMDCEHTDEAQCTFNCDSVEGKAAGVSGISVESGHWDQLNKFASRTYVPASEASRQGAGPSE